jgi:hypothetical protein
MRIEIQKLKNKIFKTQRLKMHLIQKFIARAGRLFCFLRKKLLAFKN